jgi:magnesium chelatase subunit H
MFTNTSPETKRVIPANLDGKVKFKIVYVVLESQYQSALTKACNKINEGKEGVAVEAVGYLLEELRNPENLEAFKKDVADANIFIGSLIFVQELADKVRKKNKTSTLPWPPVKTPHSPNSTSHVPRVPSPPPRWWRC